MQKLFDKGDDKYDSMKKGNEDESNDLEKEARPSFKNKKTLSKMGSGLFSKGNKLWSGLHKKIKKDFGEQLDEFLIEP